MSVVERELALLRHPRLAALATSAWPAWLWSADGSRILWANAAGAAIFGAVTVADREQRRFAAGDATAAQIIRLAATLPAGAQERLERLRGFGAGFGRALTCLCSRIVLADGKSAVLAAAAEPAGPALTLDERVRRLFAAADDAIAAFAPDGALVYANAAAQTRLAGVRTLSALGIETLAATALETGSASGTARLGEASFAVAAARLGIDAARVLVVTLPGQPGQTTRAQSATQTDATPAAAITDPAAAPPPIVPVAPTAETAPAPTAAQPEPIVERRYPLRFVWHMDADGRFGVGSDEFIELAGPRTMATLGRLWSEIADELQLDPGNEVARAVATRETWSGIVISWPVDEASERLPIELSGLPVFDRDRSFRGYRGFGVCREIDRINQLAQARRERPMGFMPAPEAAPPQAETAATPEKPAAAAEPAAAPDRSAPSVAPASANVVPFRPSPPAEPKAPQAEPKSPPALSPVERRAFRELAQELTSRLRAPAAAESGPEGLPAEPAEAAEAAPAPAAEVAIEHVLLDRIPIGVLVYRHDTPLYANRHFLEWTGYENLAAIEQAGGLNTLFAEPGADALAETGGANSFPVKSLSIVTHGGDKLPVEGRMFTVPWNGSSALALILTNGQNNGNAEAGRRTIEHALGAAEDENRELKSVLDAASDGIITLDAEGRIVAANARAAALFGKAAGELAGRALGEMLAPESERAARDYFERVARGTNVLNNVLDIEARIGADRLLPLAMTLARIGGDRFCAVFRDATERKQTEEELRIAKREAMRTASAKAEFLAKVSHEIRTPLNAMTGFAEVIMAERFGPIGNERYREYVKDIHGAGTHLVALLNDLLDLSRIETGQTELNFANINLNDITQQCVGIMQPQANRARIIIRSSATPGLPCVVADERSLRQIVLNLLANSIRFTGPGGQVIVSTVFSDAREVVLRVRDTGAGMSEKDIAAAMEPFRETAISGSWGSGGTGFGLPLTKALAEANRANFSIKSALNAGTLVEIAFPPSRVVAD
jgi:PAS domain S-box-containing protein